MKNLGNAALAADVRNGWIDRLRWSQRRKLFEAFMLFRHGAADETVLDVRLRGAQTGGSFEGWDESAKSVVTACALDPAAPVLRLPYPDCAFDWIHCGEVIEHASSAERQQVLVAECYRVARKGMFLTTPNRHHPLEFNSGLPCVHWLPQQWRARLLAWCGRSRWSGLNLVDAPRLYALAEALPGAPAHDVGHKRVLGIKAHFFLMVRKTL